MMIRSRTPFCSAGGITGGPSVETAGPGVGWELPEVGAGVTGGTTRIVGVPFPECRVPYRRGSARVVDGHLGQVRSEAAVAGYQRGDPDQHVARGHGLGEQHLRGAV